MGNRLTLLNGKRIEVDEGDLALFIYRQSRSNPVLGIVRRIREMDVAYLGIGTSQKRFQTFYSIGPGIRLFSKIKRKPPTEDVYLNGRKLKTGIKRVELSNRALYYPDVSVRTGQLRDIVRGSPRQILGFLEKHYKNDRRTYESHEDWISKLDSKTDLSLFDET